MVQSVKQCAGCGAQMGARGRVCPRCGRGSLFRELIWIAVLGVLLLGIGVLSGIVPLQRLPWMAQTPPSVGPPAKRSVPPLRPAPRRRAARKLAADTTRQPIFAYAPCPGTDSESALVTASESPRNGPHTLAHAPCREVGESMPPESAPPSLPR
jgi:hypothetical protein